MDQRSFSPSNQGCVFALAVKPRHSVARQTAEWQRPFETDAPANQQYDALRRAPC